MSYRLECSSSLDLEFTAASLLPRCGYSPQRVGVRALCNSFALLMLATVLAQICYGDMNRKVFADQASRGNAIFLLSSR